MKFAMQCRHNPQKIKEIDKIGYFAADMFGASDFTGDVMVNLTKTSDVPSVAMIPQLVDHVEISFDEIMVPWPDFGLPHVKLSFWKALHSYIMEKGWSTACFHCQAGHGRTGTALAAMLIANEGYSAQDAVLTIRSLYCDEAVETAEQIVYLHEVDQYYNDRGSDDDDMPIPSMWYHMGEKEENKEYEDISKWSTYEDNDTEKVGNENDPG
jgi:hypothetical protein